VRTWIVDVGGLGGARPVFCSRGFIVAFFGRQGQCLFVIVVPPFVSNPHPRTSGCGFSTSVGFRWQGWWCY